MNVQTETYEAEMTQRQIVQAADPGDLVAREAEMSELAAFLQTTDLAEAVV